MTMVRLTKYGNKFKENAPFVQKMTFEPLKILQKLLLLKVFFD